MPERSDDNEQYSSKKWNDELLAPAAPYKNIALFVNDFVQLQGGTIGKVLGFFKIVSTGLKIKESFMILYILSQAHPC